MFVPIATTHPSIPNETWTKITTKKGDARKFLHVINEDTNNAWRLALVGNGGTVPTLSTQGFPLSASSSTSPRLGSIYEEHGDKRSSGDVYAYQDSGGPLTTLAVTEGQ